MEPNKKIVHSKKLSEAECSKIQNEIVNLKVSSIMTLTEKKTLHIFIKMSNQRQLPEDGSYKIRKREK